MRLTTKLILAFLLISLFSTGMVVAFSSFATNREFDKFVNDRYRSELVEQLQAYYAEYRTWVGLEGAFVPFDRGGHSRPGEPHILYFSIADSSGVIIVAGAQYAAGDRVNTIDLQNSIPIQVDGKTVGILVYELTQDRNPLEDEFLQRIRQSILASGLGTVILALILGAVLSRTITRPIRELTSATHELAGQKFGHTVKVHSRDEIGELAESFNKMSVDLARSFNLRKQMTADIAHELRTPLSLIIGHAEAVHDGVLPPSTENFEIVREEAGRLEQLVNDLRTLSLADAGELSVDFQPVDLNRILEDTQAHYQTPFNQKCISLTLKPSPVPLTVNLDPVRFSQVMTNILDNALKYTPEDGTVEIISTLLGNKAEISVEDSGPGVSQQEAEHLFDRFYRADEARNRNDGGSGLGLAIAKSIVEMHQGTIHAESETGKGLRIRISLPVTG